MNYRNIIVVLAIFGVLNQVYPQGAFGELSFNGTYYTAVEDGLIGSTDNVLSFSPIGLSGSNTAEQSYDQRYTPITETFPVRFGATYSRYFALSNNSYFSFGIGYSNYRTSMTFMDGEIENRFVQQHYLTFPIRFHLLSNRVRKQDPYGGRVDTSHMLQYLNGGIEISIGARVHSPIVPKKDIQSSNLDFSMNLERVMNNLQSGIPTLGIEPEFTISVAAGAGVTFNFTAGYLLNPIYDNKTIETYQSGNESFGLQSYYENNVQVSFSISFRGGFNKAYQ